jgi:hypothetical protein
VAIKSDFRINEMDRVPTDRFYGAINHFAFVALDIDLKQIDFGDFAPSAEVVDCSDGNDFTFICQATRRQVR